MYRLDVVTDLGTFTVHEDEIGDISEETPVQSVADVLNDIEAGNFFKGYPPDYNREKEPILFSIASGAKIKAYVVYPYIKVEEPTGLEVSRTEDTVAPFTAYVEYLGNKLTVSGCEIIHDDILYLLPITVNGEPHTEVIKAAALGNILKAWLEEYRGLPDTSYLVIVPEVPMDYVMSKEYLIDYVGGIQEERTGTNAKAWAGWKADPE